MSDYFMPLPKKREEDHKSDNLPDRANRADNRKQLRDCRIPQILTHKRHNENRKNERQERSNDVLIGLTTRGRTGQVRGAIQTRTT